jgi:hypothetical protein
VITERDSYDGEVEDISVDKSESDISTSEAGITDSGSDSSFDVEVKNSGLPHSTNI